MAWIPAQADKTGRASRPARRVRYNRPAPIRYSETHHDDHSARTNGYHPALP